MADYRIIRLALSSNVAGTATEAFEGIELTNAEIVAKTEVGDQRLSHDAITYNLVRRICVDYSGNIYGTCSARNCIVKIEEGGKVSWLAGSQTGASGNNSNLNGVLASNARFNAPWGIACDKSGTLYIADSGNHQIRTFKNGKVGVLAGVQGSAGLVDGPGQWGGAAGDSTPAKFSTPYGVAVDKSGNVFVADYGNHAVRKIKSNGQVVTIAGNGSVGNKFFQAVTMDTSTWPSRVACFNGPTDVTVDAAGNVYISDTGNRVIKALKVNGSLYRFSGSGQLGRSLGVTTDPSDSTPTSKAFTCSYTTLSSISAEASGNALYVVDLMTTGGRLLKLDKDGVPFEVADWNGNSYHGPYAVAVSPAQTLFVANYVAD